MRKEDTQRSNAAATLVWWILLATARVSAADLQRPCMTVKDGCLGLRSSAAGNYYVCSLLLLLLLLLLLPPALLSLSH